VTRSSPALRPAWLLIRLRLRRALNQTRSMSRYRAGSPDRKAASRTSPAASLLSALVGLAMLGSFTLMAYQAIDNIENRFGSVQARAKSPSSGAANRATEPGKGGTRASRRRVPAAPGSVLSAPVLQANAFVATVIVLAVLSLMLAGRDFVRPEWDLEWLATLPLRLPTLLLCRLIERVVTSGSGLLGLVPFLSVLAWTCGYRWTAPLLGIGLALALLLMVATAQMLFDTGLRLSLSPPRLKNLHAAISVISVPLPLVAMAMVTPVNTFVFDWAAALPQWAMWLPPGLAVRVLAASDGASALLWCAVMLGEILAAVTSGLLLLRWQLRDGVVAAGAHEAVARSRPRPREAGSRTDARTFLSAVQRRELLLLARDRTYMVQTLVLPALIVGLQFLFNVGSGFSLGLIDHPLHPAAIAFTLAAYALMFSAFQTLNAEGQALWILYSVPHSLESVLWQKARLWAAVATTYPLALLAVAIAVTGSVSLEFAGAALVGLAGVPIFSVIATALGVFGCDPLAVEVHRRVRATYLYLYMLLASLYVYAIYTAQVFEKVALVALTALVAMALWQKARDHLGYLLDPSAAPPARVSLADGLIAALLFFTLQGLVGFAHGYFGGARAPTAQTLWIAFCVAGAVTYAVMRLVYWRAHTVDVPRLLGDGVPRALLLGAIAGAIAALVGLAYLHVVPSLLPAQPSGKLGDPALAIALAAVAILAAPVFEEFIFRGLIFRGLRRSFGVAAATLAGAAIFALVHPVHAIVPVFVLGVCAALVYERTRMLAAPMMVHAIYNAVVVGTQWNAIYG